MTCIIFYDSLKTQYGSANSSFAQVRSEDGLTLHTKHREIRNRWPEQFRQLLDNKNNKNNKKYKNQTDPEIPQLTIVPEINLTPPFEEFQKVLVTTENHKSAGTDDIAAELLKYEGDGVAHYLHKFFHCCWETEQVQQKVKDGKFLPSTKGRATEHCATTPEALITLLSNAGKTLSRIMVARLLIHVAHSAKVVMWLP